jgi:hypothetical protein
MKIQNASLSNFLVSMVKLLLGLAILIQMGNAIAAPTPRLNRDQLFSCTVLIDDGQGLRDQFKNLILAQDPRDAAFQCRQTTYNQCLDLADRIFARSRVNCEGPYIDFASGGNYPRNPERNVDTFCRQSQRTSNTELVVVKDGRIGDVILESTFESQCNNARAQLKQNGRCFCGQPASSVDSRLICLDRQGQAQIFGDFTFESQCRQALGQILEGR